MSKSYQHSQQATLEPSVQHMVSVYVESMMDTPWKRGGCLLLSSTVRVETQRRTMAQTQRVCRRKRTLDVGSQPSGQHPVLCSQTNNCWCQLVLQLVASRVDQPPARVSDDVPCHGDSPVRPCQVLLLAVLLLHSMARAQPASSYS
jgi:hypothetical protein